MATESEGTPQVGALVMDPRIGMEIYREISRLLARVKGEIDDANSRLRTLDVSRRQYEAMLKETVCFVCPQCHGGKYLQHWYAQDDVKAERCTTCSGSGLAP